MRVAVILSGCGHLDGAEIREAVLSLLYLDKHGAEVSIFAPDVAQKHVINHAAGQEVAGSRNVLEEAARIARGKIAPLATADANQFDALVIPGGFGVAKNLSNFVDKGADCEVNTEFKALAQAFYAQKKPIVAICIAPAVLMAALKGVASPTLTIGEDAGVAGAIAAMGGVHECCASEGCVVDETHRIITASAYMRNDRLSAIAQGIEQAIDAMVQLIKSE
jgi:enhancing lycopene biosynthesis protein 2